MVLAAVGCCLGAAAFAATRPDIASRQGSNSGPLQPRITEHPEPMTTITVANFDISQPGRPPRSANRGYSLRYQCRLDGGEWEACRLPARFAGLGLGRHRFAVRAVNENNDSSPAASFGWRVRRTPSLPAAPEPAPTPVATPVPPPPTPPAPPVEPVEPPEGEAEPFTIEQTATLPDLYPGAPPQPIPLRLENPNPIPIAVTALSAAIAADPPGCPSAENFVLVPAVGLSAATPLRIPAESAVELPAPGIAAPTIAMLELPVSQDACQAAELELRLEGDAVG
jgi:hypothetical protein